MKSVSPAVLSAAHRLGFVLRSGAVKVGPPSMELPGLRPGVVEVSEFALPTGEVVARRVRRGAESECWLRADLAEAAAAGLLAESAADNEIAQTVCRWALEHPERGPADPPTDVGLSEALVRAAYAADKRRGRLWGLDSAASRRRAAYAASLKGDRS